MNTTNTLPPVIDFDTALNKMKDNRMAIAELSDFIGELGSNNPTFFRHKFEGGLRLLQVPGELSQVSAYLLQRFAGKKIRYLEVGVASCGTLIFLGHLFRKYGIDFIPSAVDDFSYTSAGLLTDQRARVHWCEEHLGLEFFECDSSQRSVEARLGDNEYDLIFIDADHSFIGCLIDFLTYLPHLERTGVLLFHDVRSNAWPGVGEVFEFARDLFKTSRVFSESNICGIGLLEEWRGELPSALDAARITQRHLRTQARELSVKPPVLQRLKQKLRRALRTTQQ